MKLNKPKILIAEDEPNFGAVLKSYLALADYSVDWCKNGKEAYSKVKSHIYDLCILDIMMPEMDGFSLAKEIKYSSPNTPFIFLSAKSLKEDVIKGFKTGADDYLVKPFDSDILLEKIKAILRRKNNSSPPNLIERKLTIGKYFFHSESRLLKKENFSKQLSPKEAELLILLLRYKNKVMPREIALKEIWGEHNYFTARSMDVFIAKLRQYLRNDPDIKLINIHGKGFKLCVSQK